MKTLLFPHCFQKLGWCIFAIGMLMGIYIVAVDFNSTCLLNNVAIISIVSGGILATCSCEKVEDEMVRQIRLNSLLVALYVSYAILILLSLFVYDLGFLTVMMYNMFTILLVFMAVFRYKMWRTKKGVEDEQ